MYAYQNSGDIERRNNMIKLEHTVLPSPEQMEFIIEGMRNPMNSWDNSDSRACLECRDDCSETSCENNCWDIKNFGLGKNDYSLMQLLTNAGTDHRKFMRMIPVYVRITAPLYWWKEFDTYKVGTVANSCSTMHKIQEKEFTLDDFSHEHLEHWGEYDHAKYVIDVTIENLNYWREKWLDLDRKIKGKEFSGEESIFSLEKKQKEFWWQMIQLLPSSYNQTRNVMINYEVLANIYKSRKSHKLDEWREFCSWIKTLPYSSLIIKED